MKKIIFIAISSLIVTSVFAQDSTNHLLKKASNLTGRANDHLLLQFGYTEWAGRPDTIHTKGFPRSFNAYFLFDFPFKSNPHISVAIGAGVGTDNIYFDKTYIGIKDPTPTLQIEDVSDTTHFKKYKLATATLEAPVELRYSSYPANSNKSFKVALGLKAGVLVNAHTKGKDWQSSSGQTLIAYTGKESSKRFFNSNRFVATARIGYGVFSVFGTYQLNPLFKEGLGPDVRPFTVGLTLSGL